MVVQLVLGRWTRQHQVTVIILLIYWIGLITESVHSYYSIKLVDGSKTKCGIALLEYF